VGLIMTLISFMNYLMLMDTMDLIS